VTRPAAPNGSTPTLPSGRRTRQQKQNLYALLAEKLQKECGLDPTDLIVSIIENDDKDWSFGQGRAQFLTGELR
jgi:phenylpyruvate tautomerase PptA (4-oxalocrotonate tautomerase family)